MSNGSNDVSSFIDDQTISIVKSESEKSVILPPSDHCETTKQFLSDALAGIEDGDVVSVEICKKGRRTNRIDLAKGIAKIETSSNPNPLIDWKLAFVSVVITVPWIIGAKRIGCSIVKSISDLFDRN